MQIELSGFRSDAVEVLLLLSCGATSSGVAVSHLRRTKTGKEIHPTVLELLHTEIDRCDKANRCICINFPSENANFPNNFMLLQNGIPTFCFQTFKHTNTHTRMHNPTKK